MFIVALFLFILIFTGSIIICGSENADVKPSNYIMGYDENTDEYYLEEKMAE